MGTFFLLLIAAVVVGAIVFGVAVLITGDDPGIEGNEPDGRSIPLPGTRPLAEGAVTGWARSTPRCAGPPTISGTRKS
jgi:hypothetical protein